MRYAWAVTRFRLGMTAALAVVLGLGSPALAQGEMSEEERVAAAEAAYDRGSRAFEAGRWEEAAGWYERADVFAPAAAALGQAVRAWGEAGRDLRAATVAAELIRRDAGHAAEHGALVESVGARALRVEVGCEPECTLEVDGAQERFRVLFLSADAPHFLRARFEEGERDTTVSGAAGETRALWLQPAEEEGSGGGGSEVGGGGEGRVADSGGGGVLPPAVFIGAAAVTAVLLGVTVWSALDTSSAASDYEAMPTITALQEGQDRETRTNVLLGVTLGAAALTGAAALLTDWEPEASVAVLPGGAMAMVGGRL